jgi:GNAT superfamily N-acetyltransferase
MTKQLPVFCRPARENDTADMLDITRTIWDGHDYVPEVWADWLTDPDGQLVAAEHQGRVIGVGKLTRLSDQDWWFEGLRVHPDYQGQGIASQLHDYMVETWMRIGGGVVRLGTNSNRYAVHHMCERSGFEKIGEFTFFTASTDAKDKGFLPEEYQAVAPSEVHEALALTSQSSTLSWTNQLVYLYWRWAPPREIYIKRMIEQGNIYWWRGRQGLLAFLEDEDPREEKVAFLQIFACSEQSIPDFLNDYRRLAAALGYSVAALALQPRPEYQSILESAGFLRDWDELLYIYAKTHPKE